jgi:hypothetical protein
VEDEIVNSTLVSVRIAKEIGEKRLLLARLHWDNLFESASPPGAVAPSLARASLTRVAIARKESRRRQMRSGLSGFLAAVRQCS